MTEDKKISQFIELSHANQLAINSLTNIVERTSADIDKLVQKQNEMLISQERINVVILQIQVQDKRLNKLENSLNWLVKTIIGTLIITVLAGIGFGVN